MRLGEEVPSSTFALLNRENDNDKFYSDPNYFSCMNKEGTFALKGQSFAFQQNIASFNCNYQIHNHILWYQDF